MTTVCQDLVASIATVPVRVKNGELRACVDALLAQTLRPSRIFVVIPQKYLRFPALADAELPAWMREPPYHGTVVVLRPAEDPGPIAKYLAVAEHLAQERRPLRVFVGDDDQVYHPRLLERMWAAFPAAGDAVVQNRYGTVRFGSGGVVHGFVGLMVSLGAIRDLPRFPRTQAGAWIDDQVMSIYFALRGVPILPSGVEAYTDIYAELQNGHEKGVGATEALHVLGKRQEMIGEMCRHYACAFCYGGSLWFYKK